MSTKRELKAESILKNNVEVAVLDDANRLSLSQYAVKPATPVLSSDYGSWTEPYAVNSFETDGALANRAEAPYNATFMGQTNNISAFAWTKIDGIGPISPNSFVFSHADGVTSDIKWFMYENNGFYGTAISANGTSVAKDYRSVVSIIDGQYHHVGFTFSSGTLKIYLDGVHLTGGSLNIVSDNAAASLFAADREIGLNCVVSNGFERPLDGTTHGYTYWDKQLSDAEVTELYNSGKPYDARNHSAAANLVLFYPVNRDTIASGIIREIVNGQHANIFGAPTISTDVPDTDGTWTFFQDQFLEVPGVPLSGNTIPSTESPVVFPASESVAYTIPNTSPGGSDLSITVDVTENVPAGAVIVARRYGQSLIVGTGEKFPKNKIQTKILAANVTADGEISSLTFNNLTPGKFYTMTGQFYFSPDFGGSSDFNAGVEIHNGSQSLDTKFIAVQETADASQDLVTLALSLSFQASESVLTFEGLSLSANSVILGDGTKQQTYVQLEERQNLQETSDFT